MNLLVDNMGTITNLQRFSLDDGPGIRTTVFFKGCNLHCIWCHNPESIRPYAELAFAQERCTNCGVCSTVCGRAAQICTVEARDLDRVACIRCMDCVDACYAGALSTYGRIVDEAQLMKEILRDRAFYAKSGGGVTFSGGEPMLQLNLLQKILAASKEQGIHTAVDTAGNVPTDHFFAILPYTDLFLYDIKAVDPMLHRRYTGVDNVLIHKNLRWLAQNGARIWVRLPYAPGLNHTSSEIDALSSLLTGIPGIERVELLPYHRYGQSKYESLGLPYTYNGDPPPDNENVLNVLAAYQANGLTVECPTNH